MKSTAPEAPRPLTNGNLFLNALILAGLAAVLGMSMADVNAAADAASAASSR